MIGALFVAVGEDEMSPILLPFTQSPPMAKLDKAITELDGAYAGLTVPGVPVPSWARVGATVGSEDQGSVDAAVREGEVVRIYSRDSPVAKL